MPNSEQLIWLGAISFVVFVLSLLSLPWLVAKIPEDYFCHDSRTPTGWKDAHPAARIAVLILKNLLGYLLLAGGIIMLFIPGQGLLTIAMGLVLMDYPGKFALERRLVSIGAVNRGLNWLRAKRNVPPLRVD